MSTGVSDFDRAQILIQALPYIQNFYGKTIVVKYGGNAMIREGLKEAVLSDMVLLSLVGIHVVLVHGGGPEISNMLQRVGKQTHFVNGLRYTDDETIGIVQMVLAGNINKELVCRLQNMKGRALGFCGIDGGILQAKKLVEADGTEYGQVGEVVHVDAGPIQMALSNGYIPVVATVAQGIDGGGQVYNVNADTAAAEIAIALNAEKLILLTDTKGVLKDAHDENTLISEIRASEVARLREDKIIEGGMLPKLECCVKYVNSGKGKAHIIDGRISHSILIEMLSDEGIGTMIRKD
ncbi:MAG: acetylglutamate kinase [Clostridia bacterium]|nr:acetylglutamate kinase [Clostridia bacterium]